MTRSAWTRASTASQPAQWPQPVRVSHCKAAANASATTERPDPAGPVISQLGLIAVAGGGLGELTDDVMLAGEPRPDPAQRQVGGRRRHACSSSWQRSSREDGRLHGCGHLHRVRPVASITA